MRSANSNKGSKDAGISFIDVILAVSILTVVMLIVGYLLRPLSKGDVDIREKSFATQKAIQMIEELRGAVQMSSGAISAMGMLDDFNDVSTSTILSVRPEVKTAADPVSGNADLRFYRRVSVFAMPKEPQSRRVFVRVYKAETGQPLAEVMTVMRSENTQFIPHQLYEVVFVGIENIPSWWTPISSMHSFMESIYYNVITRAGGLRMDANWIDKLGVGRDPQYRPYLNRVSRADDASALSPLEWVYYYPGWVNRPGSSYVTANTTSYFYFSPEMRGKLTIDTNPNNEANTFADQFNHTMRYPDELAAGGGETTLRQFLEEMAEGPGNRWTNHIIVNLHGDLLPLPPMRNYSDPAKDPENFPNRRAVTHPQRINYPSGVDEMKLRVYTYVTNPNNPGWTTASTCPVRIMLLGPDIGDFPTTIVSLKKLVLNALPPAHYEWQAAVPALDYTVTALSSNEVEIVIPGSPLICHQSDSADGSGLPQIRQLYGYEYIPCVVGPQAGEDFLPPGPGAGTDIDLTNTDDRPKNTARWIITVQRPVVGFADDQYTIESRINSSTSTWPNLSRTYVWVGPGGLDGVPYVTERYQYVGDPRHMPYADVKAVAGYNRYFMNIPNDAINGYEGYGANTFDGWDADGFDPADPTVHCPLNIDVPRYHELWREALLNTSAIFCSVGGFSNYYVGLGGDIGGDQYTGFPEGLPLLDLPWKPGAGPAPEEGRINEISHFDSLGSPPPRYHRARLTVRNTAGTDDWVGLPWIGELYPDDQYPGANGWKAKGNLKASGDPRFYRAEFNDALLAVFGSSPSFRPAHYTQHRGASSFVNGKPSGPDRFFSHEIADTGINSATVNFSGSRAVEYGSIFNMPIASTITALRPFALDFPEDDGTLNRKPPEWNDYSGSRVTTAMKAEFYRSNRTTPVDPLHAMGIVNLTQGGRRARLAVVGGQYGTMEVGVSAITTGLYGFLAGGEPGETDRIRQVDMIYITSPPVDEDYDTAVISSLTVVWHSWWSRWDGKPYTVNYGSTTNNPDLNTPVSYNIKYSLDGGNNWYFINTSPPEPALLGIYRSGPPYSFPRGGIGQYYIEKTALWQPLPPAAVLKGKVMTLLVEGYRDALPDTNYSYHQIRIFFK